MATTVNISFPHDLLAEIDTLAKKEHRSRSELVREATRLYIARKDRRDKLFVVGEATIGRNGLCEQDVAAEIRAHRRSRISRRS